MRRYQLIPSHAVQTLLITTTSPITSGEVTLPYSFSFNAIGGTPPYTWSETGTLPTGFTLSGGGTLSGTPSATYANSFNVTVTDNIGSQFTRSFNLTIVAAVSITTTSPLPNATESSSYSFTMAATGGFTPYTWSLLSSTGSNSWSVSPTGVITGLPGSVEIDTLDIQVVDALGVPSAANFNLTVNSAGANGPAIFTTGIVSALPNLVSGSSYSYQVTPTQGVAPYNTFSLVNYSCDIPSASTTPTTPNNSYTISTGGVLTATANISGTVENDFFLISFKDNTGTTYSQNFAAYNAANHLKIITPSKLGYITQGNTYTSGSPLATIQAAGNAGSVTWSITAQTTSGATNNTWAINSSTGAITGTATNTGVNTLTVQAFDGTNTTTEFYNIGVYDYVTGAPRPAVNPGSGTVQGITSGPGLYVRANGELYEPNGTLFRINHGWAASFMSANNYGGVVVISTPWYNALGMNTIRTAIEAEQLSGGGTTVSETAGIAQCVTQHTTQHRVCIHGRWNNYSGTLSSGGTTFAAMQVLLQEWIAALPVVYAGNGANGQPMMNQIIINPANEFGPYSDWGVTFQYCYAAVSGQISGMSTTTLTINTVSATHPFANNFAMGVYVLNANGVTSQLCPVTAVGGSSGAWTLTGTFPSGYLSGGAIWGGVVGIMRAAGYYCPLTITASGGSSYNDLINYMPAVMASDPLQSVVADYHAYWNDASGTNTQAGLESAICVPMNTNKLNHGIPWTIGEQGIYYVDARAGSPVGGFETNFPTPQFLQSFNKYGIGIQAWVSYTVSGYIADSVNGANRYAPSPNYTDTSEVGHPTSFSVHGKRVTLDPIYGGIVSSTGGTTSF